VQHLRLTTQGRPTSAAAAGTAWALSTSTAWGVAMPHWLKASFAWYSKSFMVCLLAAV
jgi:hypothetical protein